MAFPVPRSLTRMSGEFGPRKPIPLGGGRWSPAFHGGVDFTPLVSGTTLPVYAVGRGVVYGINLGGGAAGNNIMLRLDGDGSYWWYGHLSLISVRKGQRVNDGQQIGRMGRTGNTTGVHLHLERHWPRLDAETDPWPYIRDERDVDGFTSSWQTGKPPVAVGDAGKTPAKTPDAPAAQPLIDSMEDTMPMLINIRGKDYFTNGRGYVLVENDTDRVQLDAALQSWAVARAKGSHRFGLGRYNGAKLLAYLDKLTA